MSIELKRDSGGNRPAVLLFDRSGGFEKVALQVAQLFEERDRRALVFETDLKSDLDIDSLSESFSEQLSELKVKHAPFIAFAASTSIPFKLYLSRPKLVRTMTLVDATSRAYPSSFERALMRLESSLPLGLPFRRIDKGFDVKPFLQRVRCPVLNALSWKASDYTASESEEISKRLPTAWSYNIESESALGAFVAEVIGFQDVPAKCPQKGRAAA